MKTALAKPVHIRGDKMAPESQFHHKIALKPRKSRKLLKNYDVIVLRDAKAKGQYRKGEGFRRGPRVQRKPIMGDALMHNEDVIWLRA